MFLSVLQKILHEQASHCFTSYICHFPSPCLSCYRYSRLSAPHHLVSCPGLRSCLDSHVTPFLIIFKSQLPPPGLSGRGLGPLPRVPRAQSPNPHPWELGKHTQAVMGLYSLQLVALLLPTGSENRVTHTSPGPCATALPPHACEGPHRHSSRSPMPWALAHRRPHTILTGRPGPTGMQRW